MELFKKAAKEKIRFQSKAGMLTIEDLFDLPLTSTVGKVNLNDLAKGVSKELRENSEEDFVTGATKSNTLLTTKLEILKSVIETRVSERDAKIASAEKAKQKELILNIIGEKQNEELKNKSIEELKALLK